MINVNKAFEKNHQKRAFSGSKAEYGSKSAGIFTLSQIKAVTTISTGIYQL
jgi:hypothetical protein